jgi:hypothetical protein
VFDRRLCLFFILVVLTAAGTLVGGCSEDGPQDPGEEANLEDTTPPAAVTGLYAAGPTRISMSLVWNAPGDDGDRGQADRYDIRYSTSTITEENWDDATPVADVPAPKPAGQLESFIVKGLGSSTRYYFALKSYDEVPNESGLSNNASEITQTEILPPDPVNDLLAEAVSDTGFLLTWTAVGDDGRLPGTASLYDIRYSDQEITPTSFATATQVDGEPPPRPAGEADSCLVSIPGADPEDAYYFAMKVADEVPNWSTVSKSVRAIGFGQSLIAYPTDIDLSQTPAVTVIFRGPSPPAKGSITVTRQTYVGGEGWISVIIKRVLTGTLPVGVHTIEWDLTDDAGIRIPAYYGQLSMRLYARGAPVDSVMMRLFD